jgi:hypothetical protein
MGDGKKGIFMAEDRQFMALLRVKMPTGVAYRLILMAQATGRPVDELMSEAAADLLAKYGVKIEISEAGSTGGTAAEGGATTEQTAWVSVTPGMLG